MSNKQEDKPVKANTKHVSDGGNMCLELALEGERLCKAGDCRAGVAFFLAAIRAGTEDLRTLSAIYSQLGNAYFYLGEYEKAMQYHQQDLSLAKTMNDKLGEAKSNGNLGNAFKVMGMYNEAIVFCQRHLEIAQELKHKLSEGRALYNLGNVYHAKGKHIGRNMDPGEYTDEVKDCLKLACKYYEENLEIMKELEDIAGQGRSCGNLGNTNYLLGNFNEAIKYHEMRLEIAIHFEDKAAERRAHSNLGNSHIFLGEYGKSIEHYKCTLALAQELNDKAIEAQAYYSLANTCTLMKNYPMAIEYHLKHRSIANELQDTIGEGRACWSLGNVYTAKGDLTTALEYAKQHLVISKEIKDIVGQTTALANIAQLQKSLGIEEDKLSPESEKLLSEADASPEVRKYRVRRQSMEQLELIKLSTQVSTELPRTKNAESTSAMPKTVPVDEKIDLGDDETFFDSLSRLQSKRMDDQRCSLSIQHSSGKKEKNVDIAKTEDTEKEKNRDDELMDFIIGIQSKRMDEQRAELPNFPGGSSKSKESPLKVRPDTLKIRQALQEAREKPQALSNTPSTVPDEDFFSLIMRLQAERIDDQRAILLPKEPKQTSKPNVKK